MKINNLLLPHPVLGRSDDVVGEFRVKEDGFSIQQDNKTTKLSVEFILKNKTLEALIKDKNAIFNVEVECSATFFRKSFLFSDKKHELIIEKNNLRDKVTVSFYITSSTKIFDYKIEGANDDYEGHSFNIGEGDVLAYAGDISFDAEILWEDLRRIFNIIKIEKDSEREDGLAEFDIEQDIIKIKLPVKDYLSYDGYKEQNDNFTDIYHSALALPALIYALSEMMSDRKDKYMKYKWYRVIDSRKDAEDKIKDIWDPRFIPDIAQIMVGEPLDRTFCSIEKLAMER